LSELVEQVLAFWFGTQGDAWFGKQRREWFRKDAAFDAEIRSRFGALHEALARGEHEEWLLSARGALAYVIVLDQFSRNLFRDDPRAFAHDALARRASGLAIERDFDGAASPIERGFFYLPFIHSEDLGDQDQGVALFDALADGDPTNVNLDYARKHRAIIARFGRFPHRNRVLGRESTAEEVSFLAQPGSGF
jgi:uncharacterized protein (DUF924 family)